MFIERKIKLKVILQFAWKMQLVSFLWSAAVFIVFHFFNVDIAIPFLPVATIGTAVAFYVGFKNNSAYDRVWEARKIWGNITNATRSFAAAIINFTTSVKSEDSDIARRILYRHLAWLNMLRIQLRKSPVFNTSEYLNSAQLKIIERVIGKTDFSTEKTNILTTFLSDSDKDFLSAKSNIASAILLLQHREILALKKKSVIDEFEHINITGLIQEFYNYQGASERIKSFPFPRQYANFSFIFVYIFVFLLPFALVGEFAKINSNLSWLVIPFTMLIAWVFNVMEQVGDASENPFDNGINDIPMTTICRNLEIELRESLDEKNIPERVQPVQGIVM
jgi:putative membrane protein